MGLDGREQGFRGVGKGPTKTKAPSRNKGEASVSVVYACQAGHTYCNLARDRGGNCPTCNDPTGPGPDLADDPMAANAKICVCTTCTSGCDLVFQYHKQQTFRSVREKSLGAAQPNNHGELVQRLLSVASKPAPARLATGQNRAESFAGLRFDDVGLRLMAGKGLNETDQATARALVGKPTTSVTVDDDTYAVAGGGGRIGGYGKSRKSQSNSLKAGFGDCASFAGTGAQARGDAMGDADVEQMLSAGAFDLDLMSTPDGARTVPSSGSTLQDALAGLQTFTSEAKICHGRKQAEFGGREQRKAYWNACKALLKDVDQLLRTPRSFLTPTMVLDAIAGPPLDRDTVATRVHRLSWLVEDKAYALLPLPDPEDSESPPTS